MTTEQGRVWSAAHIPDQSGRRALITGANSGIGFYTALELAKRGATVVLACRDSARGDAAAQAIRAEAAGAQVEVLRLDLASLRSVHEAAASELARGAGLDLLINNAGVMAPRTRRVTEDGFELQFGTNVLGHFALTALLLPALARAAESSAEAPRIVTIASIAHKRGRLSFDDLQSERSYSPMGAYGQTKLANLMFAFELDRRLQAAGAPLSRIMSVAAHPGVANTNLFQVGDFSAFERVARRAAGKAIDAFLNSDRDGAIPTLFAATAASTKRGGYFGPQGWKEMRGGDVGEAQVARQALDREAAARLWSECERLTALTLLDQPLQAGVAP